MDKRELEELNRLSDRPRNMRTKMEQARFNELAGKFEDDNISRMIAAERASIMGAD